LVVDCFFGAVYKVLIDGFESFDEWSLMDFTILMG